MPATIELDTVSYYGVKASEGVFVTNVDRCALQLTERPTIYSRKHYAEKLKEKAQKKFGGYFEVVEIVLHAYEVIKPKPVKVIPQSCDYDQVIWNRARQVFADQVGYSTSDIGDDTTQSQLGMDSLDLVEIVIGLEDEFNIDIPDEEAEELKGKNFGEVVAWLKTKLKT